MFTVIPHITEHQQELLLKTISRIVKAVKPEKIICYGSRHYRNELWTAFSHSSESLIRSDFDVLIVTSPDEKHKDHEVLNMVNNNNSGAIRLIPLVHSMSAVNEAIQQGSKFFNTVCSHGTMLYDRSALIMSSPIETACYSCKEDSSHWEHHVGLASQFLAGAFYYLSNEKTSMSVFMLHQATEHACIAIIYACLGYRATTHNLNRLIALTENISQNISQIFPQTNESDRELFKLLVRSYSDVRYRQKFTIHREQTEILYKRVKNMILTIEKLHSESQSIIQNVTSKD